MKEDEPNTNPIKKRLVFKIEGLEKLDDWEAVQASWPKTDQERIEWAKNLLKPQFNPFQALHNLFKESELQWVIALKKLKKEYGTKKRPGILKDFEAYALKNGLLTTHKFRKFLNWYGRVRYPDSQIDSIPKIEFEDLYQYHLFELSKLTHPNTIRSNLLPKDRLSIEVIALKLHYEGRPVNRKNCNEIIKEFGWKSGDRLYNRFSFYRSTSNRTGDPGTDSKLKNKIKLFIQVIENLDNPHRIKAIDELRTLEKRSKIQKNP